MTKKSPNPTDKFVGQRVRMRRMMMNMSQEKLGDALGLTFQQVQKYEKGTNRIGASRLQKIAEVLDVPVGWFFEGADTSKVSNPDANLVTRLLSTPDGLALARAFDSLPGGRMRRFIVYLVAEIAKLPSKEQRDAA